jgi:adenylate kinase
MKEKQIYIFVGPPGSGKGSLSSLCTNKMGWVSLSTGNLFRKHILEQSHIGKQIDFAIKSGKLVSDELVSEMVRDWFVEYFDEMPAIILDGYPRTVVQAGSFLQFLREKFGQFQLRIVRFFVADETVVERLSNRYICKNIDCQSVYSLMKGSPLSPRVSMMCDKCDSPLGRRSDDEPRAIRERLTIYHQHEKNLLQFYLTHKYPVIEFNVDKKLHDVFEEFKQLMCLNAS